MPVGTKEEAAPSHWRVGETGTRTHTHPSQLYAIRGSKPSKRRSVMEPRRSLVSQGSWVPGSQFPGSQYYSKLPCHLTGLPPRLRHARPSFSLSLSRSRVCRHCSTIGQSLGRTVIALLVCAPPGLVPVVLFQGFLKRIVTTARTGKGDKASALHSIRPPLGPHRRGLGGPIPASDESPKLNHDTAAALLQKLSGC